MKRPKFNTLEQLLYTRRRAKKLDFLLKEKEFTSLGDNVYQKGQDYFFNYKDKLIYAENLDKESAANIIGLMSEARKDNSYGRALAIGLGLPSYIGGGLLAGYFLSAALGPAAIVLGALAPTVHGIYETIKLQRKMHKRIDEAQDNLRQYEVHFSYNMDALKKLDLEIK